VLGKSNTPLAESMPALPIAIHILQAGNAQFESTSTPLLHHSTCLMAPEDKPVVDSPGLIVLERRQIGQGR